MNFDYVGERFQIPVVLNLKTQHERLPERQKVYFSCDHQPLSGFYKLEQ